MVCPGISQNTKQHHLNLYKGQVWKEKAYVELCNQNVLSILYDGFQRDYDIQKWPQRPHNELVVLPVPSYRFLHDQEGQGQIPWDNEILQSFTELTNITKVRSYSTDWMKDMASSGIISHPSISQDII